MKAKLLLNRNKTNIHHVLHDVPPKRVSVAYKDYRYAYTAKNDRVHGRNHGSWAAHYFWLLRKNHES